MTELDPLKIPAFMRRRRPLKDTSFQPTPKFKVNIKSGPLKPIQPKPFSPRPASPAPAWMGPEDTVGPAFEAPLLPEVQPTLLPVGIVTHYYGKLKVAVLKLSAPLATGAKVQFMGEKGVFIQKVSSLQINREPVAMAPKGAEIGMKVKRKVVLGEIAYLIY